MIQNRKKPKGKWEEENEKQCRKASNIIIQKGPPCARDMQNLWVVFMYISMYIFLLMLWPR